MTMRGSVASRRRFLSTLALSAGAAPLLAQSQPRQARPRSYPTQYSDKVMRPVSVYEMEAIAESNLDYATYHYVAGGSEDEYTLRANVEAYRRVSLRRRVMVDVSDIDTSITLLGHELESPILLSQTTKNGVVPNGDRVSAVAAHESNIVYCISNALGWMGDLDKSQTAPTWWGATLGHVAQPLARNWARRQEDAGATGILVTVDHPYSPNRDRNIRNGYGNYAAGVLRPTYPALTWDYLDWLRSGSSLPIIVKGILNAEDAVAAIDAGAAAISVSNHGGRALDGATPTLMALPDVVASVDGRIPVLIDGGIRRGGDILKALALGADAVLLGRAYVWGLAAFGQIGVQRVVDMLRAELKVSMALAGMPSLASIDRSIVRLPWE